MSNPGGAAIAIVRRRGSQLSRLGIVELPVTDAPDGGVNDMNQVLKPYLLLACVAFVLGFASYLVVGRITTAPSGMQDEWQATISAPAPAGDAPLASAKRI